MAITYRDAGVDLKSYAEAMGRLPALIQRTQTPRVLPLVGGFAGLFQLQGEGRKYRDPVLVSGTDGVGTKLKVAILAKSYHTVGIDLVAMCVNDCLCLGAEPLFFLDYVAVGKDDPDLTTALVKGVSDGCLEAGAALIGGETAIMPDLYQVGDFDMAGFCVGVVEKESILDGKQVREGDVLIGLESSGLHSNGFSLARKAVLEVGGLTVESYASEFQATVGEVLLVPTRIYAAAVKALLGHEQLRDKVSAIAHITGGGLAENTGRVIPAALKAVIRRPSWKVPEVFNWVQRLGGIDRDEMFRVFNMGIGLVVAVRKDAVDAVQSAISSVGVTSHVIGEVTGNSGSETAEYED
ncbi:phosphoribosylformylglycinamidine cyclo-ligase [Planctomicrobium sp. SH664]|uniref:phosphoribosylformylglycinamidine cyclo-ligase n=1 Tax=Planctomicrobium sp. SH664 TaxID=3448125 RepID=UPI003F5C822C